MMYSITGVTSTDGSQAGLGAVRRSDAGDGVHHRYRTAVVRVPEPQARSAAGLHLFLGRAELLQAVVSYCTWRLQPGIPRDHRRHRARLPAVEVQPHGDV